MAAKVPGFLFDIILIMALTAEKLTEYMREELDVDTTDIAADSLLFSTGIVDSFALVSLMTFIESECDIRISPDAVTLDNFDSIDRILAYADASSGGG